MWQEQLYAPDLLDILLLYLGLGPCLYIKTQYLKWSILLSINEGQGRSVVMFSKGPPLVVVVVCESNSPPKIWEVTSTC